MRARGFFWFNMAKSLNDMVTSAQHLAGLQNSTKIPDSVWQEWVTRGIEDLWDELTEVFGADHFTKTTTINTVSGTEDYNLPADFLKLETMYVTINSNALNLEKFEWADEARLRNSISSRNRPFYRIIGSATQDGTKQIKFLPVPEQANVVTVRYAYKPVFASGTDEIDGLNGFEEYAELIAAIKAMNHDEADPSMLMMDAERVKKRIRARKASVDKSRPAKISRIRRAQWLRRRGYYSDEFY